MHLSLRKALPSLLWLLSNAHCTKVSLLCQHLLTSSQTYLCNALKEDPMTSWNSFDILVFRIMTTVIQFPFHHCQDLKKGRTLLK